MPYAIELALDARTAAIVRRAWDELAAAGFPSFPAPVIYLGPTPSGGLSALQQRAHARLGRFGRAAWAHYLPGAWVPHCTLAMDFTPADLPAAIEIARRVNLPLDGRFERIGIVGFRPVRELVLYPLTGR